MNPTETGERGWEAFQELVGLADRRGKYGRRYDDAKNMDVLFVHAGEAVCMAAGRLAHCLPLPRRGRLVVSAMRRFSPARYSAYIEEVEGAFCAALVVSGARFGEDLHRIGMSDGALARIREKASMYASAAYQDLTSMPDYERDGFGRRLGRLYIGYEDDRPADMTGTVGFLAHSLRSKLPLEAGVSLIMELHSAEAITEPFAFMVNHQRLAKSEEVE